MARSTPQFFGRCFSYPQGSASILPVIISLFAVTASTYPLPWTPWYDDVTFACIQRKVAGTLSHSCYSLMLTDPMYWDERDDDMYGWGLQLGALFALASAVLGGISLFHLVHATCFALTAVELEKIYKSYMVCALLSLFTMIALAVDPCKAFDDAGMGKCTRHRTHLSMGATGEIAACFFFLWAAWKVRDYAEMVRTNALPQDNATTGSTVALMHKGNDRDDEEEEIAQPRASDAEAAA